MVNQLLKGLVDFIYETGRVKRKFELDKLDNYFGPYWHTHRENLSVIDCKTLKAVGQTVLQAVYQEESVPLAVQ